MTILLNEFKSDLGRIRRLIDALELLRGFPAHTAPNPSTDPFIEHAVKVHGSTLNCHADIVVLSGTAILYMAGRFEHYIRTVFEELCDSVAKRCNSYDSLPRVMRTSLISMTAEVMKTPRKYGHADKGVEAFIKTLALNLTDRSKLESINSECLSITYDNMRPDTLEELFKRIGAERIWERVGAQATVQAYYQTADPGQAKNKATSDLNKFMDIRNRIAHPSHDVTWPDADTVIKYMDFLEIISDAILQVSKVFEVSHPPPSPSPTATPSPSVTPPPDTAASLAPSTPRNDESLSQVPP